MTTHELAQLNIAVMKEPLESPGMADFVANLDRINALAESSPGFVWRFQTAEGDATAMRPLGDDTLINLSVWQDLASLNAYVYQSAHVEIMRRRREWFERLREAHVVLWWVAKGYRPSVDEAVSRLNLAHTRRERSGLYVPPSLSGTGHASASPAARVRRRMPRDLSS